MKASKRFHSIFTEIEKTFPKEVQKRRSNVIEIPSSLQTQGFLSGFPDDTNYVKERNENQQVLKKKAGRGSA